eukprot:Lankesteria_metandrocarpae@DN3209_c2_g1_i1.p1
MREDKLVDNLGVTPRAGADIFKTTSLIFTYFMSVYPVILPVHLGMALDSGISIEGNSSSVDTWSNIVCMEGQTDKHYMLGLSVLEELLGLSEGCPVPLRLRIVSFVIAVLACEVVTSAISADASASAHADAHDTVSNHRYSPLQNTRFVSPHAIRLWSIAKTSFEAVNSALISREGEICNNTENGTPSGTPSNCAGTPTDAPAAPAGINIDRSTGGTT